MCVGGKSHYTPESQHRRFEAHAKFEAYSCLLALMTWKARIRYLRKALVLWGDAEGILRGVMANKAWEPVVNEIVAELRLALAPMGLELEANHWWSEENTLADELSRRGSGEQPQSELLKKAKRATMPSCIGSSWDVWVMSFHGRSKQHGGQTDPCPPASHPWNM